MILVRFKDTFRERMPEWITSTALFIWGLIVLTQDSTLFSREFFSVLATIASQAVWGWTTMLIGAARVVALFINGAWRPTGHIRALGALFGTIVWAGLIMGYLVLDWNPPALATQAAMLAFDISALWFAAGDAKIADVKAQKLSNSV